jgi:hypothetical protein
MPRRPTISLAAASLVVAAAATAEPVPCADPMLAVEAPDPATAARVCTEAIAAKAHPTTCSLTQSRPVTIEIRPEIHGPADHCAGLYACGSDRVTLIPPDAVRQVMPEGSVFAVLDPATYYDSLVVHELAHALMDQADCALPRCAADTEYVAYALQIDSLPEAAQDRIRNWRDVPDDVPAERLNDFLLMMKPDIFAVTAWAHFDGLEDGCAFVADLVGGAATLALPDLEN